MENDLFTRFTYPKKPKSVSELRKEKEKKLFDKVCATDKKADRLLLLLDLGHGGCYTTFYKHTWEYERPWGDTADEVAIRKLYQTTWEDFGRGKGKGKQRAE